MRPGGGPDRGAVGEQQVQPGTGRRTVDGAHDVDQDGRRVVARPKTVADQRPQQRGVTGGIQRQQIRDRQLRSEPRHRRGPAPDHAVVAEQPATLGERCRRRRGDRHARCRRAHRGEHPGGRRDRGESGEPGVRPQRAVAAVARRAGAHEGGRIGTRIAARCRCRRRRRRRVPARSEPVRVHRATAAHVRRRVRLVQQAVRRIQQQRGEPRRVDRRRPDAGTRQPPSPATRSTAGSASRAQRNPEKICRRTGWSQLRNVPRIAAASVPNEPPRSTR